MKPADIADLMEGIEPVLSGAIASAVEPLQRAIADVVAKLSTAEATIAEMRAKLAETPAKVEIPEIEITADTPAIKAAIVEAIESITINPSDERFRSVIREEAERAAAALPPAPAGKSVTVEEVTPMIETAIAAGIETAIGLAPGVSFSKAVKEACTVAAQAAVAALPPAPAGKSVTIEEVEPRIIAKIDEMFAGAAFAETLKTIAGRAAADAAQVAVAALPPAEPGKSVTLDDVAPMISETVGNAVAAAMSSESFFQTIAEAAKAAAEALPPAKDGDPGTSVTVEDVRPMIEEVAGKAAAEAVSVIELGVMVDTAVEKAVAAIPPAEPGKPGESVTVDDVAPVIVQAVHDKVREVVATDLPPAIQKRVADAVADLPPAEPGKSVTIDELRPVVAAAIADQLPSAIDVAVKAIPVPKDGDPGVGIASLLIDRDGKLVVTKTDGTVERLDKIVGDAGAPGLGFTDIQGEDRGRDYVIRFVREGLAPIEFIVTKLTLADTYQGVWRAGAFAKGDAVTWAGSLWLAQRNTEAKPETNDDWRLVVKRGRDGKSYDASAPRGPARVDLK